MLLTAAFGTRYTRTRRRHRRQSSRTANLAMKTRRSERKGDPHIPPIDRATVPLYGQGSGKSGGEGRRIDMRIAECAALAPATRNFPLPLHHGIEGSVPRSEGVPLGLRNRYRPRPRHWQALAELVGASQREQ
jgi:hypothetical protein